MLFTALFLWSYKHFTERSNWLAVLFIAVSLAGLAYSKYHGALVLLFTVLSNLRLLKNPKFYAACLLAAPVGHPPSVVAVCPRLGIAALSSRGTQPRL